MKNIPVYTVILTIFVLALGISFRQKQNIGAGLKAVPSYLFNSLDAVELAQKNLQVDVSSSGDIVISDKK